mmetsp:Transcript_15490/g.24065  ORF Transcript_15490/g.24065 Transcript_15490/m.24065 type:complete len:131 (+) Transcript_15490:59-451(+)
MLMINNTLRSQIRIGSIKRTCQRMMSVTTLSDPDALSKFTQINDKSVVYFTATWCPPCKVISPIYTEMSEKHADVAFGKVDVDDNNDSAVDFEISAVPTFVLFNGENVSNRMSGADSNKLGELIEDLLKV